MSVASSSLSGRTAVVTGGDGVIGGCIATALVGDVLDEASMRAARDEIAAARGPIAAARGPIDILINGAGGNVRGARNDMRYCGGSRPAIPY